MCDTIVAVPPKTADGCVWFGKNSDREPGEAQVVEIHESQRSAKNISLRCTWIEIPQVERTNEIVISRPFWMWGAEMGANDRGLAIGNEAVFTRMPVEKTGLTGMDLLRLALERTDGAAAALDLIVDLIARHGQGGSGGYRNRNFRYHNSFLIADPHQAWVLETAGPYWAAERVRGVRTISNVLSIGSEFDRIHPEAFGYARSRGWCRTAEDFDFARCFGDPFYRFATGGAERSACTSRRLSGSGLGLEDFKDALRDHAGLEPDEGWRLLMPCAHASWWPTRHAGQTTGSMISRLRDGAATDRSSHWLTGTSSPCLSVFKPARLGEGSFMPEPAPGEGYDSGSLYWRHERLHRLVLGDYEIRRALIGEQILELENISEADWRESWELHRQRIPGWTEKIQKSIERSDARTSLFRWYWSQQNRLDAMGE